MLEATVKQGQALQPCTGSEDAVTKVIRPRVFFIGRKSPIFPKFLFYPRGPIKFDISQIFSIFPVSTKTIQNQPRDDPTLIMIYSCFDL
jgi:hypothetical protein